jgi:hypothetical protein
MVVIIGGTRLRIVRPSANPYRPRSCRDQLGKAVVRIAVAIMPLEREPSAGTPRSLSAVVEKFISTSTRVSLRPERGSGSAIALEIDMMTVIDILSR